MEITLKLGGQNFVFWGGREGFQSILNTDMKTELDHMAAFFKLVVAYKKELGATFQFLVEPKPREPMKHQYDYDAATVMAFLHTYGLQNDFKLNIEPNHTTLAGHDYEHDIYYAASYKMLGSVDCNTGDPLVGWDTDQFLMDEKKAVLVMKKIVEIGGLAPGGLNFDAKVRRESTDLEDMFIAHIGSMDCFARGLRQAAKLLEKNELGEMVKQRYASWKSTLGERIEQGKATLEEVAAYAKESGEPDHVSGKQELAELMLFRGVHALGNFAFGDFNLKICIAFVFKRVLGHCKNWMPADDVASILFVTLQAPVAMCAAGGSLLAACSITCCSGADVRPSIQAHSYSDGHQRRAPRIIIGTLVPTIVFYDTYCNTEHLGLTLPMLTDAFARKMKKFTQDGADQLLVIADFDRTLTPYYKQRSGPKAPLEQESSSHGLLMTSSVLQPQVCAGEQELFARPSCGSWLVELPPGLPPLFKLLNNLQVPTLVFSAGLYDVIHAALEQEFAAENMRNGGGKTKNQSFTPSNVHVVSNMMRFDAQGVIQGFDGNLIHSLNKTARVLLDSPFWEESQLDKRRNVLLLGDSQGDARMAEGLNADEIIRVGFLNVHVDEKLDEYLDLYDVVFTHDANLVPINTPEVTMSANLEALDKEAQVLRAAVDGKQVNEATKILGQLKMALTTLPALPPCGIESPTAKQELQLARTSRIGERHAAEHPPRGHDGVRAQYDPTQDLLQLRTGAVASALPDPGHEAATTASGEPHGRVPQRAGTAPEQSRQDPNIAFAVKLEQYLMEGTYNKVLESRTNVPNPYFPFFLSQLLQTVRENIADCAEVAYQCLTLADAQKMLIFDSAAELSTYIQEEKTEWVVREGRVWFKAPEKSLGASDIPSLRLVGETLAYATELDRIV
ncbi:HAD-like domain [Phytophthora cactorum]|nr:HAD-like domain [Phytophthora cactorum]